MLTARPHQIRWCLYPLLGLIAVLLPIILWKRPLPFLGNTYGDEYRIFELFGFCAALGLTVIAFIEFRKRKGAPWETLLPILLFFLVGFYFLSLIAEFSIKSWDYTAYEKAGQAVLQGENPYDGYYLYPPAPAQAMALAYRLANIIVLPLSGQSGSDQAWYLVFYLYQCAQFFLILAAWGSCFAFGRKLGLRTLPASVLVTILFLFNNPLLRTIKFNQVNLFVLALFLGAILLLERRPLISGLAAALGGHIKLFPLILLLPWSVTKKITAALTGLIGFGIILLLQTDWGRDLRLWSQFLNYSQHPADLTLFYAKPYFRDNSLHSIVHSLSRTGAYLIGVESENLEVIANVCVALATFVIIAWFIKRYLKREKAYAAVRSSGGDAFKMYGHSLDALALILIISPLVWEHLYVLAIPLVIWAYAIRGSQSLWPIGVAAFLMFGLPTFDVLPFSYHRLAGLLLLLHYLPPERTPLGNLPIGNFA